MTYACAAIDMGAEHGRVVVGQRSEAGRLALREVHRFATPTTRIEGTLRWNVHRLYGEVLAGLRQAARAHPGLASVGVAAWGADFGLLDRRGKLLGEPYHHLDRRTDGIPARLHARVPEAELWAATGTQPTPRTTLYQLYAMVWRRSSTLHRASRMLLIPDLLSFWLCGAAVAEHTIASTTQCYDVAARAWKSDLLARAGIPVDIFPRVVPSGTVLGRMDAAPARRAGLSGMQVIAPAGHVTASELAAIPADRSTSAYLSLRSSAHVGTFVPAPVTSAEAWRLGLTNEGGADGSVCLHRETAGLHLLRECRRAWTRAGEALDDDALTAIAASGRRFQAVVDADDPSLRSPDDVFTSVLTYCARTGQDLSGSRADLLRAIVEGLVWKYRRILRDLEGLLGRRLEVVHVVGEGARNPLLCQLTADACARPVLAGPVGAAALGNVLAQLVAAGACGSWEEARALARSSFPPTRYDPQDSAAWDDASVRMRALLDSEQGAAPSL